MKNDQVEIKISSKHIKDLIKSILKSDFNNEKQEKLAQILFNNLKITELGLEQLVNGILNIFPEENYKVGDWVYVDIEYLWKIDKIRTKDLNHVKCINSLDSSSESGKIYLISSKIINVIPTSKYKYQIEYNAFEATQSDCVLVTATMTEHQIHSLDKDHINHVLTEIDEIIENNDAI